VTTSFKDRLSSILERRIYPLHTHRVYRHRRLFVSFTRAVVIEIYVRLSFIFLACLNKLDMFDYLTYVEDGLKQDHYDIRMLTFLMVVRLSILCPKIVLQRLDRLIQPLKTILYSKVKANSIKQEFEKHDELRRAAIKAYLALKQIKDADKDPCINDFATSIKSSKEFQDLYDTVIREQQQSSSGFSFNTASHNEAMDMS
jgi:hypothetical protein